MTIHQKLLIALMRYDARQSAKPGYNKHAVAHYCDAMNRALLAIDRGVEPREALCGVFCGRVLDICLRAIGEAKSTRNEQMGDPVARY